MGYEEGHMDCVGFRFALPNLPVWQLQTQKSPTLSNRASLIWSLAMTYFHIAAATLSSALFRFTTEFGMGSGGSKTLLSPSKFGLLIALAIN